MANATATFTVDVADLNGVENWQKSQVVRGTVTFSAVGDLYTAGGLPVTITPIESIKGSLPPTYIRVWSQPPAASPNTFFYDYTYNPGTTINGGKVQIWAGLGAAAEFTNGAAITSPFADVILFEAVFVRI